MRPETAKPIAESITKTVTEFHVDMDYKPKSWNALAGQYLVYGFEKYFGFSGAVQLEAIVERAWKKGEPIEPVILQFLVDEAWK